MELDQLLAFYFEEDVRDGDHTSLSTIPADATRKARLIVKDDAIIAGVELAEKIFHFVERMVLNFMQRMSGIATFSRQYADLVKDLPVKILDTRKTTPGIRYFEKWAVRIGGCHNHRMGLYDMIMIKDNHHDYAGGITAAIESCKKYLAEKQLDLKIEIEVRNEAEINEVLSVGGVDRIMLDNFSPDEIREALKLIPEKYETEASGGINLDTLRAYAETGVQYISVGALTHSNRSKDMSLKAF